MLFRSLDVLSGAPVGDRVAIIGAGGIGFDVAEYLSQSGKSSALDLPAWLAEWGVTDPALARGGLKPEALPVHRSPRDITLLQRKPGKLGASLGKTTGWIHRAELHAHGVAMVAGVNYDRITPEGLHITTGGDRRDPRCVPCDTVVLCADRKSTRLNSSHIPLSRMPSSA